MNIDITSKKNRLFPQQYKHFIHKYHFLIKERLSFQNTALKLLLEQTKNMCFI